MKHICTNCHFLAKDSREPGTAAAFKNPLSKEERDTANQGDIDFVAKWYCLNCHMGVWDEGLNPGSKDRINRVSVVNRKNKCFFFPYDPSMMFDAAKELQKREQENRQLRRSNMYTIIGLWVAAISLLANTFIRLYWPSK